MEIGSKNKESIIDSMYLDRRNYIIIGLTGYAGTGCSRLAKLMATDFDKWGDIRLPKDLEVKTPLHLDNETLMYNNETNHNSIASTIFAAKYNK